MKSFFRVRGRILALVVLVMFVITLLQAGISYTIAEGALRNLLPAILSRSLDALVPIRVAAIVLLVALWLAKSRRALFRTINAVNAFFTLVLVIHTISLISVLFGFSSHAIAVLMLDVILMAMSNVLIFSIWYWIIDPPGVEEGHGANPPWEILFPQRASTLPGYESWVPHYPDYVFLAFTTSVAFRPTDAAPLSRRTKMLMLLQVAISLVTVTGIAGGAINILAGSH